MADETKEVLTSGGTVQDVLNNAGVEVGEDDKVSPKLDQNINDDTAITVTIVEKTEVTEEETVEFETTTKNDSSLEKGKTKTDTEGVNGTANVTYEIVTENGKKSKRLRSAVKSLEPTNEVILRGTKEPEPEPEASSDSSESSGGTTGASAPSVPSGSVWDRLAQCESGGNWSINTGNGYYGGPILCSTCRNGGGQTRQQLIKQPRSADRYCSSCAGPAGAMARISTWYSLDRTVLYNSIEFRGGIHRWVPPEAFNPARIWQSRLRWAL